MSEALIAQLKRHEGLVLHAYTDHLGFWTIGYGRLTDGRRGGGISKEEAELLLRNDVARVTADVERRLPWVRGLSDGRRQALCNMGFQLGVSGLLGFRQMLAALQKGRFDLAAREALDSRWAKQAPDRADEIARMIRHG
ncbi:glycoside hydrolase family protein [Algihabitans albus]|uniref:glycoside hydrolase family protein n=1 Tax=Algihabitans albus TaxID=2164067 RepID=UPI000E5D0539|nr:glycoside hydrolase family protein [Algihabitans albus]